MNKTAEEMLFDSFRELELSPCFRSRPLQIEAIENAMEAYAKQEKINLLDSIIENIKTEREGILMHPAKVIQILKTFNQ